MQVLVKEEMTVAYAEREARWVYLDVREIGGIGKVLNRRTLNIVTDLKECTRYGRGTLDKYTEVSDTEYTGLDMNVSCTPSSQACTKPSEALSRRMKL